MLKKYFSYFGLILMIFSSVRDVFAITTTSDEAGKPKVTITAPQQISQGDWVNLDIGVTNSNLQTNSKGKVEVTVPKTIVSNSTELLNSMEIGAPFSTANTSVREDSQGNYVFDVDYDSSTISGGNTTSNFRVKFIAHLPEDTSLKTVDFKASFVLEGTVNSTSLASSSVVYSQNDPNSFIGARAVGDDPGVLLSATNPIGSQGDVEIKVTLFGSAQKFNTNGIVKVSIPKSIVASPEQLVSQLVYEAPFYLGQTPYVDDGNGNYILQVNYDASKIPSSVAFNQTFTIKFRASYFTDHSKVPENINFDGELVTGGTTISTANALSQTVPSKVGLPAFQKYSELPFELNGNEKNYILDKTTNTKNNVFVLMVNYNRQSYDDVTIQDQLPQGTILSDGYTILPGSVSGDPTPVKHINIYKVDQFKADGSPQHFQFVTSQFADKISVTNNSLSVNLGKITSDDAYVITYGINLTKDFTPQEFGKRFNNAQMQNLGQTIKESKVPVILKDTENDSVLLEKKVNKSQISSKTASLEYSLSAVSNSGTVPAGTTITDPLPEHMSFEKVISFDREYFSEPIYNPVTREVSCSVLKDLPKNTRADLSFSVLYDNPHANIGDVIENKAFFDPSGTPIYSSTASTTVGIKNSLVKTDKDTGQVLPGAIFKVVDATGKTVKDNLVTDEKGILQIPPLLAGSYFVIETQAPYGYKLDDTPIPFVIPADQTASVQLSAVNQLILGKVILTKVDADSKTPLENAVFTLQDEQGNPLQEGLTTGTDGKLTINDLKPGKYKLVETQAPDGYELDATPVEFEIVKNQQTAVEVEKTNTLKPGSVVLTKVDADSKTALENAVFTLQDEQGNPLQEGLTTGTDGKLTINDLKPGKYKLVETQAPDGYELDATPVEFEIVKNQQTAVEVEKTNTLKPGSVVLTKVDADSKTALENAVFTLQDEQGNPLQEGLTTGTDGKLTINDLKPGKYKLVETQAPDGYELDATPVEFEIVKNQQTAVEVEKTNTQIPNTPEKKPVTPGHSKGDTQNEKEKVVEANKKASKELPSTGEEATKILSIFGLGILVILGVYLKRKSKY